jgi:hypothetical protein
MRSCLLSIEANSSDAGFVVLVVLRQDMSVISFEEFHKSFLGTLQSPLFADSETSKPSGISAATKELRKKRGYDIFTKGFLRSIYKILREHSELRDEQPRVQGTAKKLNLKLAALRNEMVAVQAMKRSLGKSEPNTKDLPLAEGRNRLRAALLDYESEIRKHQEYFNSMVNPAVRKTTLGRVRWEPVLKLDKYSLPTLKKKAPDQWLYERLDQILKRKMQPLRISKMTRYRVMSALLESVGLEIKPITFKQHRRRSDGRKTSVTKS